MSLWNPKAPDTDFMSELEAASNLRPATPAVLMFFSVVALIVLGFIWAAISHVEQITRGQGQVVPSQEIQIVQSLEGGILAEIMVQEGQAVKAGDILMRIDDVQFASEERGTEAKLLSLNSKKARLEAEANDTEFTIPEEVQQKLPQVAANERALYRSRQKELTSTMEILDAKIESAKAELKEVEAQIVRLTESRRLLSQELKITSQLVAQRAVPKLEEMRLQREVTDLAGQINTEKERKNRLEAELESAQKQRVGKMDQFRSQALGELGDVETEIAGLKEKLLSIGDRVARTELRAPVDGIVNNIALSTIGGVVEPAAELVEIVPEDEQIRIIARVQPNDFAFIEAGMPAKVKITAYDPTRYGALEATVIRTARNSITDNEGNIFFEIEVHSQDHYEGPDGNPLPITPGMVADVEVITGKRTILHYLLKPIFRAREFALTER